MNCSCETVRKLHVTYKTKMDKWCGGLTNILHYGFETSRPVITTCIWGFYLIYLFIYLFVLFSFHGKSHCLKFQNQYQYCYWLMVYGNRINNIERIHTLYHTGYIRLIYKVLYCIACIKNMIKYVTLFIKSCWKWLYPEAQFNWLLG